MSKIKLITLCALFLYPAYIFIDFIKLEASGHYHIHCASQSYYLKINTREYVFCKYLISNYKRKILF